MTDEEILKLANKDGFPAQFREYREFLRLKLSALELLRIEEGNIDKKNDPEGFEIYSEFSREIHETIKDEEQKFMAKNGDTLKQLEEWVKANPQK